MYVIEFNQYLIQNIPFFYRFIFHRDMFSANSLIENFLYIDKNPLKKNLYSIF